MKRIEHTVFAEPESRRSRSPFWSLLFPPSDAERRRERIRLQAETFINRIGAENVVSVAEHAPMSGRFLVIVWWYREVAETESEVVQPGVEGS
jgi:hypothetical protein